MVSPVCESVNLLYLQDTLEIDGFNGTNVSESFFLVN